MVFVSASVGVDDKESGDFRFGVAVAACCAADTADAYGFPVNIVDTVSFKLGRLIPPIDDGDELLDILKSFIWCV